MEREKEQSTVTPRYFAWETSSAVYTGKYGGRPCLGKDAENSNFGHGEFEVLWSYPHGVIKEKLVLLV